MKTTHFTLGIAGLLAVASGCDREYADLDEAAIVNEATFRDAENDKNKDANGKYKDKYCGNGVIEGLETCDDGNNANGDGCTALCTLEPCTWDTDALDLPIDVWQGQAVLGEITFDGNCDLIVTGGEELPSAEVLYRVDKDDGAVSVLLPVADLPLGTYFISALTYRHSDDSLYFVAEDGSDDPPVVYALDGDDQLRAVVALDQPIISMTVAPTGFGALGDQLIATGFAPTQIIAIDPDSAQFSVLAQSATPISVVTFAPDGTLYVADNGQDRIATVSPEGQISSFFTGIDAPEGLAIAPDGSRMFVAHLEGIGRIDEISIPDATLTPGVEFELSTGFAPTGIVVDGANHVLYSHPLGGYAVVSSFTGSP